VPSTGKGAFTSQPLNPHCHADAEEVEGEREKIEVMNEGKARKEGGGRKVKEGRNGHVKRVTAT
jgi:hypothetical protein